MCECVYSCVMSGIVDPDQTSRTAKPYFKPLNEKQNAFVAWCYFAFMSVDSFYLKLDGQVHFQ